MTEPLPRPADPGTVDADNPWPGLASFREADREFFHGREPETRELLRMTLRERLTVLFGLSGLGKTSLLRAGLFPLVRQENLLPVHIRLDFSEGPARLTLTGQVRQAISAAAQDAGIEAPAFPESETLWETLHRQGAELWNPRNRIVTPLLVFDQFEEVFTLGRGGAVRIQETEAFLTELADLCEGSVPAALRERLEADPSAARDLSLTRHPYKILLSLREDFLPELEGLRGRIRSIVHNRFRLRRMNGGNALRVITEAGGHLVEPDVPDRVIHFVAGRDGDSTTPLTDLEIEPALLSVVCRELNNKRRAQKLPRITADLVRGNRDEILSDLYERSVEDLGPEVRSFIEERLLTKSGFRDSVALENAIELPGVTRAALDRLTDRRLLRIEDRGGMQRLELTHDVLTGVIRKSRDLRRAEEAEQKLRRSRLVIALLGLVLIGVVALAVWGFAAQRQARKALASSDVGRASNLRDSNPAHALAYLARALRSDPESVTAQSLLTDLLLGRSWPRLVSELRLKAPEMVQLSEDGRLFAAVSDGGRVRLWDTQTLQQVGEIDQDNAVESLAMSRNGHRLLIISPATAQLWDISTGTLLLKSFELDEKSQALLSPDGQWLALTPGDQNLILRRIDTGKEHRIVFPAYPPELAAHGGYENLGFSPDSRKIFAHDSLQTLLWDVETGRRLPAPPAGRTTSVTFSPDSRHLLITGDQTTIWELKENQAGRSFGGDATQAWLNPTGEKLVSYDKQEATVRIWDTADASRSQTVIRKRNLSRAEISEDGQLLLTISAQGVELWDAETGLPVSEPFCDCLDGRFVAGRRVVTADDSGVLRNWRSEPARTGTEILDEDFSSLYPFFSPDGSRFAARTGDRTVRFWDTNTAQPAGTPVQDVATVFLGLSQDGRFLFERSNPLKFWNTRTGRRVGRPLPNPPSDHPFSASHFNPARETLGIQSEASTVQLWSLATGQRFNNIHHYPAITSFAFSRSGEHVATAASDGGLRLWDLRTGSPLGDEIRHESGITAFDISPDGQLIATGTQTGLVRIWDLRSGKLLAGPHPHRFWVSAVRFELAGRALMVSARNLLRLWDTRTGRPLSGNLRTDGVIWSTQLSQDGERLLINSEGEPIRLLDSRTGQPLIRLPIQSLIFTKARLSPSGQLLWIAVQDKVHIFVVPRFSKESRDLLADWAEAVGGWTFDEEDRLVEMNDQLARLNALRRRTAGVSGGKLEAAPLIRWFLSDPATRPSSPVIDLTIEQIIRRHLEKGDWCGAAQDFPGHPLLLEHLPSSAPACDFQDREEGI